MTPEVLNGGPYNMPGAPLQGLSCDSQHSRRRTADGREKTVMVKKIL